MSEQPRHRFETALAGMTSSFLRFRVAVLLTVAALTVLGLYLMATRLRFDNSVEAVLSGELEAMATLDEAEATFGADEAYVVIAKGDVYSRPFLERLKLLHEALEGIELDLPTLGQTYAMRRAQQEGAADAGSETKAEVETSAEEFGWGEGEDMGGPRPVFVQVASLVSAQYIAATEGAIEARDVVPSDDETPLRDAIRANLDRIGGAALVGDEGRRTLVLLRSDFMAEQDSAMVAEAIGEVVAAHEGPGFELAVSGVPMAEVQLNRMSAEDMQNLFGISLLVMLLWMAYLFRHPLGVLTPITVVILSLVAALGAMAYLDVPVTGVSGVLSSFLLCVGISDAVHLQSVFRDQRAQGVDAHEAAIFAVRVSGAPVIFTSLTTMAGLLSFRASSIASIQNVGTFGAFGVLVALVLSLVLVPVMLSFHRRGALGGQGQTRGIAATLIEFFAHRASRAPGPRRLTLIAAALGLVLGGVGIARLKTHHDPMAWVPAEHPLRLSFDELGSHFGGVADVTVHVKLREGHKLTDPAVIKALESLEQHVLAYDDPSGTDMVASSESVLNLLRQGGQAIAQMRGETAAKRVLPTDPLRLADALTFVELTVPRELDRVVNTDRTQLRLMIRVPWREASAYAPLAAHIEAGAQKYLAGVGEARATGSIMAGMEAVGGLVSELLQSSGLAFAVVGFLVLLLLRDVKLGLLAMVPNVLPVVLILGLMGMVGVPLDLATLLISAIVLGIAVDDTIHFLHHVKRGLKEGLDVEGALSKALSHCGRALVLTSLILASGFMVYMAAYLANAQRFGLLVALALLFALMADLWVMPALLRVAYRSTK